MSTWSFAARAVLLALITLACTAAASGAVVDRHWRQSRDTFLPSRTPDSWGATATTQSVGDNLLYSERNSASGWRALSDHALSERDLGDRKARSLSTFPFPLPCTRSLGNDQTPEVEGLL